MKNKEISPWREAGYNASRINPISSMISADESLYLHWLAREYYQGTGEIVDGGCLLGGSTVSLASGLVANPRVSQKEKRINSYDLWCYSSGFKESILPDSKLQDGDSLLPLFLENTKLYESNIEPYPGDVCQRHWNGQSIEIFFVDFSKSWAINNHIIKEFFGSLIPGKSIVIQQDYYHYYTYWIHLTMQFFSDKYFQLVHRTNGGSVGFLLTEKIPRELLEIDYSTYFTTQQAIQLMDDAINVEEGLRQLWLIASKIRMLADRDEYDLAYPLLNEIRQSPYWHDTILDDLVHAANHLPFNMLFPGVVDRSQIIGCSRRYCVIDNRQKVYAMPLLLSESLDLSDPKVLSQAIAVNTRNLQQISEILNERFLPLPPKPIMLIGTYRDHNLVKYMNNVYAIPLKLGHINLELQTDRNKPGILVANSYDLVKEKVDINIDITDNKKELFVNENKMLFSLLIPTRNRPEKLKRLFSSIYHNTHDLSNLEIVLGIDEDDEISQKIEDKRLNIKKTIIPPGQTMGYMNRACYDVCSGRYVMLLNDDVILRTQDWDLIVKQCFDNYKEDEIVLVHVNDLIYQEELCTFPFVSRKFCELVGGNICPAEYIRYRIDDHIYNIFNMLAYLGYKRIVYLPNVIFEHDNYVGNNQERQYVYNEEIMEKDIHTFDNLLLDSRKECTLKLLVHIESQKLQHKLGRYRNNLVALEESYSIRRPEFRKTYGDSTPLSSEVARVTIGVVCADIRNSHTKKCIELIKKHTTNYELTVVDNNWDKNFNHPREMNRIIENVKTEYLVLMDDDVYVEPGWLDGLLKNVKDNVGVVTPLHKDENGKLSYAGVFLFADGTGNHGHIVEKSETPRPIPTLCSAILLIDMNKCGHIRMNERNKKYFLDIDYGLKVWEAGYEVVCTSEVGLIHLGGGTLPQKSPESTKLFEPDRQIFVNDWIDTGRLQQLENGIWQNYPYIRSILDLCRSVSQVCNPQKQGPVPSCKKDLSALLEAIKAFPQLIQELEPKLIEQWGNYNLVLYRGSYIAVPISAGKVDLSSDKLDRIPGVVINSSIENLKKLLQQQRQSLNPNIFSLSPMSKHKVKKIAQSSNRFSHLFANGNYSAVAMNGDPNLWETYAAMALMGKIPEALQGLERFDCEDAYFYQGVAHWMDGNEATAIRTLEKLSHPHAQNLLSLIRKPQIRILAQLPWNRSSGLGSAWDLLTASAKDGKFLVNNVSFHPEDLPNQPYADVHKFYDSQNQPDLYVCQMVEWHQIPPNIQELPCPILGYTSDYDLHIQAVLPWLKVFDEVIVLDSSEWEDVHQLIDVPVSTFPKAFGISASLPPIPTAPRDIDVFQSGTVLHPYHLDKAPLLHQVLKIPNIKVKAINTFLDVQTYQGLLGRSKVSYTYVRHPGAMPTRALDALSLGCAVVVQKGCILTLYLGAEEGLLTYESQANNLASSIQHILEHWPEFEQRARKGAEILRREFELSQVASQYLRFLTFLAAKPRSGCRVQPREELIQKRYILNKGWLPARGANPILQQMRDFTIARFQNRLQTGAASSNLSIDIAREIILYHWAAEADLEPYLIKEVKKIDNGEPYNIILWKQYYYALPLSLGPIDLEKDDVESMPGVFVEQSLEKIEWHLGVKSGRYDTNNINWIDDAINLYCKSIASYPRSLVVRFNLIRVALHCGKSHHISDALKLAEETISLPISYWHIDVLEDVFSWDFFPGCFNYRSYLDLVVKVLVAKNRNGENSVENSHQYMEMVKLILASIYYYLGHYSNSLANFKKSMELDPMFPIYKLKYAENLMETGRSQDSFEAGNLLAQLSGNSLVSREAFVLLKSLYDKNIFVPNNWQELESLFNKAYNGSSESNLEIDFLSPGLVTLNQSLANKNSFSIKKKLDLVKSKLLSVVVTGRNDDYMGNFKYRLTTCLNYLCRNLEHLRRLDDVEILITDWNSDVPLANVLTLSPEASRICKFVCVPPEIAARLQAPGEVFYPTCAMNTSLRRAKGEFVMMFDADSLMPYHSVRSLLDVLEGKQPVGLKLDQTFFYSSRHHLPLEVVQRELSLEQLDRYLLLNGPGFSKDEGWPGLGVCGAAQMMHRSLWQECRGYNQDFRIQGWLDAELTLRVTQHYAWVDLLSLGVVLFHMEHWADNRQGKENLQKHNPHDISSSLAVNDESWGLGDYELEIKRVSGFVDYQTTGFHN